MLLSLVALGALLGGASGCGARAAQYESLDGEALFKRSCMSCHGVDGRARGGGAPSYRGVRADWDAEKLLAYIDDPQAYKRANRPPRLGKRYMPPVDRHMPEAARRRLVEHVLGLMDSLEVR